MRIIGIKPWQFSILLSFQILATCAFGQSSYFVSSAGSDGNNGTSTSTPWQTITKVNSVNFASGAEIYFRSGDTFYGQININRSNVTVGSYGLGNKPVISGGVQLTGWSVYSGSIYVAQASSFVKNLHANGVQMTLARYPNSGFISITYKTNSTIFDASGITQSSGYWNGANCRLRTNGWTFESLKVSTQTGTTIVLASAPHFDSFTTGWGFYLDNKLAALDAPGEWFYDPDNNRVYFYAPGGVDPNTLTVIGSIYDYGVYSSSSYITVKDMEFHYQTRAGLNLTGGNNNVLSNTVFGGLMNGIFVAGNNCVVDNNTVQDVNCNGIQSYYGTNCRISNNLIRGVGLVQGYQSVATAYGILSSGTYATISNNYLDGIGYDGIFASSNDIVQQNIVNNTMLTLADGGAIYTDAPGVTIQNNVISDVIGNNEGTSLWGTVNQSWSSAMGIYMDNGSNNGVVKDNTIIRAKSNALMVNYSTHDHTIRNNTAYDCASNAGGFFLHIGINTSLGDGGHDITQNIFYPASSNQTMVEIQDVSSVFNSPGNIDYNYYLNPHGNPVPFETLINSGRWTHSYYTFDRWNDQIGLDTHSKYIIPQSNEGDTIFVNNTAYPMLVNLPPVLFYDLDNNSIAGSFTLAPFSSKVLIRDIITVSSSITVSPASLPFGNVALNTSVEQTYTLSGSNLIPAADSLTIAAPDGFTVSTVSGSGYASSKRIAYTNGTLSATTIYVKFTPTEVSGYGINITNSGGSAAVKNVGVTGMGISSTTPALTVNPASLPFGNVIINTSSSERTFTLAGSNLTPAVGNITVTAPAGYQVSTSSGSGFSSSVIIYYSGATLSLKTIYVKFSPEAVQSYTGNIVCTTGSVTKNVAVTGSGFISNSPVIAVSPGSLAFSTVRIDNTPSTERIYTLQGSYLTPANGSITITAPAGYEVSLTSGAGFNSSLDVTYAGGTLAVRTVYVRFSPTAELSYAGNITNVGGGAPSQNVEVSGRGISSTSAAITVNPTSLSFRDVVINTTSNELNCELTGINLSPSSDSLTITASDGFTISTVRGSGFASIKRIAYANGILQPIPKIIYVRFSPTAIQSYYGVITCSGGGAGEQTISVSGNGISQQPPSLTADPATLSFGNVTNYTVSGERYYRLTGSNLIPASGRIIIEATAGFEVSQISGANFYSRDTIDYTGGTLSAKIYARFLPTFLGSYNGNILNTGGGTVIGVPVSGSGAETMITVNPPSLHFTSVAINDTSSERSFTISAANLTPEIGDIVLTVPSAAFQVSPVSGSGFGSSVQIHYSGGAITTPKTIYVRFLPTAEQSYSGNITIKVDSIAAQDVSVSGLGISASASIIKIDPTSLLFENVQVSMTSSPKTYTLAGKNLVPADGNVTVTAPAGFLVSSAIGTDFNTSLTIPYSGGVISAASIYVRFQPAVAQNYTGNIANTGGNAAPESVYVSGRSLLPSLIFSSDSLPFGSVLINTSSIKTYTLSGSNLQPAYDTLRITAPPGFKVSTKIDSGFDSSIGIPYIANSLSSISIYVQFTPAAMQSYRGNITHFCGGAAIQQLPVSGERAIPSLTVSPPSINFGNVSINSTSAELTYRIDGSYLTPSSGNIIVNAPNDFEVSVTSGSGFNSSVNIPYINSTLSSTVIYIRFSPSAVSNYAGNISNDGGGATTQSIAVNGTGVNAASLFVDVDSLSFGSIIINSVSSEKLYALSGFNLAAGGVVKISSSKGFQVSTTSGAGFDTTISIFYSGDSLSSRYIYVRFSPTSVENYIGTITNAGGGIPAVDVAVSGACLPPNQIVLLGQNFPNPFNPTTKIPYSVRKKSWVKLTIFNMLGQRIRVLIDEEQDAGYYQPEFNISRDNNGQELSSGVYFYRLEIAGISAVKKLILLK